MPNDGPQERLDVAELVPGIRNGVRAVILKDDHLLLLRKVYEDGSDRYVLPGGSQDAGETLAEALQRECREEIDTEVTISGMLYLADYFKQRDTTPVSYRQQVEFFFLCSVSADYQARNGYRPDRHQDSVVWVALGRLEAMNLFPRELCGLLATGKPETYPVYLGKIR